MFSRPYDESESIPGGPHVGQIITVTRSGTLKGGTYRVMDVRKTGIGCWSYDLEPVTEGDGDGTVGTDPGAARGDGN